MLDLFVHGILPGAPSLALLYSFPAIVIGLVHAYLPYMILTCYLSLAAVDDQIFEAARSLGARAPVIFWKIVLPLAAPGLIAGSILIFVPVIGSFMEPRILGGKVGVTHGHGHRGPVHPGLQLAARLGAVVHDAGRWCLRFSPHSPARCAAAWRRVEAGDAGSRPPPSDRDRRLPLPADRHHGGDGLQCLAALRAAFRVLDPLVHGACRATKSSSPPTRNSVAVAVVTVDPGDGHRHVGGAGPVAAAVPRPLAAANPAAAADRHSLADHRHGHAGILLLDRDRPRPAFHDSSAMWRLPSPMS